jgi:hypothetical protein
MGAQLRPRHPECAVIVFGLITSINSFITNSDVERRGKAQGLPFYARPVIGAGNRPYLGGLSLNLVPFAFPGNLERVGDRWLKDEQR